MNRTDSVHDYLRVFNELRRARHWNTNVEVLRVAALTLAAARLTDPEEKLEAIASELRSRAGWTSPLKSSIRYAIAAMVLRRGASAARVHTQVRKVREMLRKRRLPRGGTPEVLAAFMLALHYGGEHVPAAKVKRLGDILLRWKDDHPYITGADDYPMAALHALHEEDIEDLGQRVEGIYQELARNGFGKGNQLQLASHLLAMAPWDADAACGRFLALAWAFRDAGAKVTRGRYDETAILSLTHGAPGAIAETVLEGFEVLRNQKPRPWKEIAFSLASGIALSNDSILSVGNRSAAETSPAARPVDLVATTGLQSLLGAQQAAIVACLNSSVTISGSGC